MSTAIQYPKRRTPFSVPAGFRLNAAGGCSWINPPVVEPYEPSDEASTVWGQPLEVMETVSEFSYELVPEPVTEVEPEPVVEPDPVAAPAPSVAEVLSDFLATHPTDEELLSFISALSS